MGGGEFKYLHLMAKQQHGGVAKTTTSESSVQEKGDSLLPVYFTPCPLINAIIRGHRRGCSAVAKSGIDSLMDNNLVDFYG